MNIPRFGVEYTFYVSLLSIAGNPNYQTNPTLTAGDVKVAKADGVPVNLATLPVVDVDMPKRVKVVLSADEMASDGNVTVLFADVAGNEWADLLVDIPLGPNQQDGADDSYEYALAADGVTVLQHRPLTKVAGLTKKGLWVKGPVI